MIPDTINKMSATHRFEVQKDDEWVTCTLGTLQEMKDYQEAFIEDGAAEGYYEGETPRHRITSEYQAT